MFIGGDSNFKQTLYLPSPDTMLIVGFSSKKLMTYVQAATNKLHISTLNI